MNNPQIAAQFTIRVTQGKASLYTTLPETFFYRKRIPGAPSIECRPQTLFDHVKAVVIMSIGMASGFASGELEMEIDWLGKMNRVSHHFESSTKSNGCRTFTMEFTSDDDPINIADHIIREIEMEPEIDN